MTLDLVLPDSLVDEPGWPETGGRPVVFLTDASSRLERRLMHDWVERTQPGDISPDDVTVTSIPRSRRRRPGDWSLNPRLRARLANDDDAVLVPLRVVWLAPERNGRRRASWLDLLRLGDPRDPDPVRQRWILWRTLDRCRIVAAEGAAASELRSRWEGEGDAGPVTADDVTFAEYVSLQAHLALEVAERRLRGTRYKVPRLVREDILSRRTTRAGIAAVATETGRTQEASMRRAAAYLKEIAAAHSPYVIDLLALAIRGLIHRAYGEKMRYDRDELAALYQMGQEHPLVFLPSHKSNLDHLVLQLALWENGLPQNHTAGGINLNFFPVGPLVRRSGVFFIRRTFKDNPLYKLVLRLYLTYLVEKRFPLEWYIEGGRSRSGKLRAPRYGMLRYVFDAWRSGASDDVVLIPVSIAYDQLFDVGDYAREQRGEPKRSESVKYVVDSVRRLGRPHGSIHLRFGRPVSVLEEAGSRTTPLDEDELNLAVQKLAFETAVRINEVTPITPISLVTLALLGTRDRALSVEQTLGALEPYLAYVKERGLPTSEPLQLDSPERVREALDQLVAAGVLSRYDAGPETVYAIEPAQHLAAAYYRNTIIHFFVDSAIAELALLRAAEPGVDDPEQELWAEALRLRDLLKFEFFFRKKDDFLADLRAELDAQGGDWRKDLAAGDATAALRRFRPYKSHWVLRPFLEAYLVAADALARHDPDEEIDPKPFLRRCLALGEQYRLQRRIESAESVSMTLFGTALDLAANRGLVVPAPEVPGPDLEARREAFAAEIRAALHRIDRVDVLVAGRAAGMFE